MNGFCCYGKHQSYDASNISCRLNQHRRENSVSQYFQQVLYISRGFLIRRLCTFNCAGLIKTDSKAVGSPSAVKPTY